MRIFLLILVCFFSLNHLHGQEYRKTKQLSGRIIEINSKLPIHHAVILIQNESNQVLAFTESDSSGKFSINYTFTGDTISIKVKLLGFNNLQKKISTSLSFFEGNLVKAESIELKEVVIQNRRSIEVIGDTVDYKIDRFTNGTEKNIIDVLAKLPGIEVAGDKIKFQGKEIEAVLLDGDNLTGRDYSLIPKSVSADFLSGVQVIKKFSSKNLLKGVTKESEEVAINLKLQNSIPVFGQTEIGVGKGEETKYDAKLQFLVYVKKIKAITTAHVENLGNDIEVGDIEKFMLNSDNLSNSVQSKELIRRSSLGFELLPDTYNNFQRAQSFSNSTLLKTSQKIKITSNTKYFKNDLKYKYRESFNYFLAADTSLFIDQQIEQTQMPINFSQEIKLNYIPSDNKEITSTIELYQNSLTGNQLNSTNFSNSIEKNFLKKNGVTFSFNAIVKKSIRRAYEWNLVYSNSRISENISIDFLNGSANTSFFQPSYQANQTLSLRHSNYLDLKNNFYGKISFCLNYSKNIFSLNNKNQYPNEFMNLYIENDFSKKLKKFTFFVKGSLSKAHLSATGKSNNYFLYQAIGGISFEDSLFKNYQLKTKVFFDKSFQLLDNNQLYSDTIRSTFRQSNIWLANLQKPIDRKTLIWFTQINKSVNFDVSLQAGIEKTNNDFITQNVYVTDNILIINRQEGSIEKMFYTIKASQYLTKLRSSLLLGYNHEITRTPFYIESQGDISSISKRKIDLLISTPISKNIDLSTGIDFVNISNKWLQSKQEINYFKYYFNFTYRTPSLYSLSAKINGFQFIHPNKITPVFFSDLFMTKKFKNSDFSIELRGHNLFNVTTLLFQANETGLTKSTNYSIQPRFIAVHFIFKLK
jgi:hypothetical protein